MRKASQAGLLFSIAPKAPPPRASVPPPISWTGLYIGGDFEAEWSGRTASDTLFSADLFDRDNGATFIGGGHIGTNIK